MENLKLLLQLYIRPAAAMSEIMDTGSWAFAVIAVLVIAIVFAATVNQKLHEAYAIPVMSSHYSPDSDSPDAPAISKKAIEDFREILRTRPKVPLVGDTFFRFFTFNPGAFYQPLLAILIFYVPLLILLVSLFTSSGTFRIALTRDYGTLATCSLMAWAAAHLPFEIIGAALYSSAASPLIYLGIWAGSSLLFGIFMLFALRTALGVNYGVAAAAVACGWIAFTIAMYVFQFVSPWMLSPFLLFWVIFYFGGSLSGGARGLGNSFRQRQNFKRFLHNATVNPRDADAHIQLGLIYQQRRQDAKALEHFTKAVEIDPSEIDGNYQLGRIARENGDLQKALDHFAIVVEQDDKYALNEIWREIGVTYLAANMYIEAADALEKFVERRPVDPEGLYYLGQVLKAEGKSDQARKVYEQAIDSVNSSPPYRQREIRKWKKMAEKEI